MPPTRAPGSPATSGQQHQDIEIVGTTFLRHPAVATTTSALAMYGIDRLRIASNSVTAAESAQHRDGVPNASSEPGLVDGAEYSLQHKSPSGHDEASAVDFFISNSRAVEFVDNYCSESAFGVPTGSCTHSL